MACHCSSSFNEVFCFYLLFVVASLAEKQKRLQEVESIKEDASANYVRVCIVLHFSYDLDCYVNVSGNPRFQVLYWTMFIKFVEALFSPWFNVDLNANIVHSGEIQYLMWLLNAI